MTLTENRQVPPTPFLQKYPLSLPSNSEWAHIQSLEVCWSLVWPQLRFSPPFSAGGGLRRLWGVPFQFSFQLCKRKAALGCPFFTVVFQGETAFPVEETAFLVEDPGPYLLSPATQIRTVFMEEISDPGMVSREVYERTSVTLEGTQSPDTYASSCLSPVLEQDLTRLWHPSPGLPEQHQGCHAKPSDSLCKKKIL